MNNEFFLLDSRAGTIAAENGGNLVTGDNGKYVLFAGTLKECCKYANISTYGEHCIVSDNKFNIMWEIYNKNGDWCYRNYKKPEDEIKSI